MELLIIIVCCLAVALVGYFVIKHTKKLRISNVYFISGAVKTGKSFVSVALAVKVYKKQLFKYKFKRYFLSIFSQRFKKVEKPMLYSNIKLRFIKHNPFTKDILLRKVRIPYGSVVLLDETSLIADSMLIKDKEINSNLLVFFKLWGHYSRGGYLITNSQAVADNHYSLKRCMSRYLYIYERAKFPFISRFKVRELVNSEDNQTGVNVFTQDLEDSMKNLYFLNKYYKYYDCYCYSIFTDNLTIYVDYDSKILTLKDNLKTAHLVTLQDFCTLDRRVNK